VLTRKTCTCHPLTDDDKQGTFVQQLGLWAGHALAKLVDATSQNCSAGQPGICFEQAAHGMQSYENKVLTQTNEQND